MPIETRLNGKLAHQRADFEKRLPRRVRLFATLTACLALPAFADSGERSFRFDIDSESLSQALRNYGQVSGQEIIFTEDLVVGKIAPALKGEFTAQTALERLLKGSGLTVERTPSGAFMIRRPPPPAKTSYEPSNRFVPGAADGRALEADDNTASPVLLEEVVVTAQKRVEKLADVPMSVSVVSGEQLLRTQSTTLQDIVNRVPGLQLVSGSPTSNQITIRGISTGAGAINSSVATYVDETPYTAQGPFAGSSNIAPNFDPYDIARVEVLRGPQGTLYGANALGGLLKYVTNAPDPSRFSASVLVGGSSVDHGGAGYETHGMVNIPLADNTAFRLVASDTHFPGYIDDPVRGKTDINDVDRWSVRAAVLWLPAPDLSIRLSGAYQHLDAGDLGTEDLAAGTLRPLFGDLKQERALAQRAQVTNEIYNATINWDLKFATLTSASSYSKASPLNVVDDSLTFGPILSSLFGGNYGAVIPVTEPVHSFTQEIRLASQQGRGSSGFSVDSSTTRRRTNSSLSTRST